eukprot:CAMPEP_0194260112 /NCGR_PEP_ID=MMETSP0158-20130606/45229_1 /TAXON_ID=33649 /ORGANISM="Thalassionema nitzschioides, Strain L26-B" /LENGTH=43 /DNA_ID= /DNA_START= /DNA_END= /DNA_ORIENTATION=
MSGRHSASGLVDPKRMEEAIQLRGARGQVLRSANLMKKVIFKS